MSLLVSGAEQFSSFCIRCLDKQLALCRVLGLHPSPKNQALRAGLGGFEQLVLALVGCGLWGLALGWGKAGVQSLSSLSPWENTFPFPRSLPVPGAGCSRGWEALPAVPGASQSPLHPEGFSSEPRCQARAVGAQSCRTGFLLCC